MNIQPRHLTLEELLHNRLFRIPKYQRAYSWQTRHRKDLFNDIEKSRASTKDKSHFMATIVGLRREKQTIVTDEYQKLDIVDGQQRITTLILLLKAISKSDSVDENVIREIQEMLVKPDRTSLLLLQTNHYTSDYFADYLRNGNNPSPTSARTLADRELLTAMHECERFVDNWKKHGDSLGELVGHLKNRLSFILHEIDEEATVYTVFEVLNSRGLDVLWLDRLKSMLMAVVFDSETGNRNEIIKEIHGIWSEIYRIIGLHLGLSTESLRFAATLWSGDRQNRLLSEEDAARQLHRRCEGDSAKVIEASNWIKSVTSAVDSLTSDLRRNAVTKIAHARLLAVAVNLHDGLTKKEKTRILRRWENVTFRIYGMHNKDARTGVGDYVRLACRIIQKEPTSDQILDELSEIGNDYPAENAVKQLKKTNCYTGWQEELRYFLYRYEETLAKRSGQNFDNESWNRIWASSASDSIEHILPQSSEKDYVHRLGNLLLLPPRLNSRLRNRPAKDKADAYTKTGLLMACEVAQLLNESRSWQHQQVNKREEDLLNWAKQEWGD